MQNSFCRRCGKISFSLITDALSREKVSHTKRIRRYFIISLFLSSCKENSIFYILR